MDTLQTVAKRGRLDLLTQGPDTVLEGLLQGLLSGFGLLTYRHLCLVVGFQCLNRGLSLPEQFLSLNVVFVESEYTWLTTPMKILLDEGLVVNADIRLYGLL
ncbi:hypothetical protein D3C79_842940 [compost metagenome]